MHQLPAGNGIDLVYDAELCNHDSLKAGLRPVLEFLDDPGVPAITPVRAWNPTEGRLVFDTRASVSLAEVLLHRRALGVPCGLRAAVQLMTSAIEAIGAALVAAVDQHIASHGNLTPWRILLHEDGSVEVAGVGLPDVELFAYLDGQQGGVSLDTLRYAPPERLEDLEEDFRSDLYTIALIGAEMALGRPVFDGEPSEIAERVLRGDAPELIEAIGDSLGEEVLDLLCVATELKPEDRFRTIAEFLGQAKPIAVEGPGIAELVADTLAARPLPDEPDEPEAEEEDEDEVTQPDVDASFALVPPVPPLPPDADLVAAKQHARAIADRTRQLAEQADAIAVIGNQRAHGHPGAQPLMRRIQDAVGKSHKAAVSTANAAKLVDLDDAIEDARMTLEMVRSAEKLCVAATETALDALGTLQGQIDDLRAERQQLERAKRDAAAFLERIEAAEAQSSSVSADLRRALDRGEFSVEGATDLVRAADDNAADAKTSASRAKVLQRQVATHDHAADAVHTAEALRKLAEEVEEMAAAIDRVARQLNRAEDDAREALRTKATTAVSRAQAAELSASQSVERARTATAEAPIRDRDRRLGAIESHAVRASECAGDAQDRMSNLPDSGPAEAAQTIVERIEALASQAEEAARQAATASDELIELAGEAAAKAAKLSKIEAEIDALEERMQRAASEASQAWRQLEDDTREVTGRTARDAIQVAQRACEKTNLLCEEALGKRPGKDLAALDAHAGMLRTRADEVDELADKALARCREARGAASRELEEIAERRRREAELQRAIERANGHAERCALAVQAAWERYHETVELLAAASVEADAAKRARAYEIIDIAEYQAGEAASAAEMARVQRDPSEALSHASTAASFEERITEDLPEAMSILERLGADARDRIDRLTRARQRLTAARDLARSSVRAIEALLEKGRTTARDWSDAPGVATALERLEHATDGTEAPLVEVRSAADKIDAIDDAEQLESRIPVAEAAARHLEGTAREVERRAAQLDDAVAATREEIEARESALSTTRRVQETVAELRLGLTERAQRLFGAIETHGATGDAVVQARERMTAALDTAREAVQAIRSAIPALAESATASEARAIESAVVGHLHKVEEHLEVAVEAEAAGIKAAERESQERIEQEDRRLKQARSQSLAHVTTAKEAAERGVAVLRQAAVELAGLNNLEVTALHKQARTLVREARTATAGTLQAARRCQKANTAEEAAEWEARASSLAAEANQAVIDAGLQIRQAVDIARRAEAEAEALTNVKKEVQTIIEDAGASESACAQLANDVRSITEGSDDPLTLQSNDDADELLKNGERTVEKLQTAAGMIRDTESLEVAQRLLETCRKTLQRVVDIQGELRDLVARTQTLKAEEADRAAQRLNEARADAEAPASEARAIAEKARGWLSTGQRLVDDASKAPRVVEAFFELEAAVEEVGRLANATEQAARPAARAATVELAEGLGRTVREAADATLDAADKAKDALQGVRSAVELTEAERASAKSLLDEATPVVTEATTAAGDATAIAEELEQLLDDEMLQDDEIAAAFSSVKNTAKAITQAAAVAQELMTKPLDAGYDAIVEATESIQAQRDAAIGLLDELRTQEATCREAIDHKRRRAREDQKRQKDEALRARLRNRRHQSTAIKREELKRRFQDREEQQPQRKPNLSVLRERLRARRRAEPEPRQVANSHQERPRRRRRDEPDSSSLLLPEEESESDVKLDEDMLESPGSRSKEEREESRRRRELRRLRRQSMAPRRSLADPPTRTEVGLITPGEPDLEDPAGTDGADALLRRLRERQRRKS